MTKSPYEVVEHPFVTEKTMAAMEKENKLHFVVRRESTKPEIKHAIEELFDVKVEDVRTLRVRGKMRRVGKTQGQRPSWKKARVRLRPGDSIEFFEGV